MTRYAIIRDGRVENVAEWDGDRNSWSPPEGSVAVPSDTAGLGDDFDGLTFSKPFDLASAKGAKLEELKARATAALTFYAPTTGPLAGHAIQTGRAEDQLRLDQSLSIYRRKIETGEGAEVKARFRTAVNEDVLVSYEQGYAVITDGIGDWGKRITHKAWDLTNAILAATTKAKLEAIDIESGWPTE